MEFDKKRLINTEEVIRYLGYGESAPDEDMLKLIKECEDIISEVAKPEFVYKKGDIEVKEDGLLVCEGRLFLPGDSIKEHLEGCSHTILCCATLSEKVDEIIEEAQNEDMLKTLLLDACANAAVEELRLYAEEVIGREYPDYDIVWQFGTGYGDLPLTIQPALIEELDAGSIGVSVTKSCMLKPMKSVSGFLGLKKKLSGSEASDKACRQRGCAVCKNRETCIYRKKIPD